MPDQRAESAGRAWVECAVHHNSEWDEHVRLTTAPEPRGSTLWNGLNEEVDERLADLEDGFMGDYLLDIYDLVRLWAPYARVVVVSYPKFFTDDGVGGEILGCNGLRQSDQRWMNSKIVRTDQQIGRIAARAGFEYVDMADVLAGHQACTREPGINAVEFETEWPPVLSESYHPNVLGHELMADRIAESLNSPKPATRTIHPGELLSEWFTVIGRYLGVTISWPGSDVVTTLVSPSGVRTAEHANGPTYEYFRIQDPEPGQWRLEMLGADVDPAGEPVTLTIADELAPNTPRTAAFTVQGGGMVHVFDARTSSDPDGEIADYWWDFGDGTTATGPVVEHTFPLEGSYAVVLEVTDNSGARAYSRGVSNVEASQAGLCSGESLQLTNAVTTAKGVDVVVAGDVDCNSQAVVGGDLRASGDVHLTNTCHVAGDIHGGGSVVLDSQAAVAGSIHAVGDVNIQSSTHVEGDVIAGGTVASLEGLTHEQLIATGVIGGTVTAGADVQPPDTTRPAISTAIAPPAGGQSLTWTQWVNQTALANGAPSWSAGLSESPGCAMAPWAASVNGDQVSITAPTLIDARASTSGCGTISLHGMNVKLGADVTIVADGIQVPNGLNVASIDGAPHRLTLLVPTAPAACTQGNAIEFSNGVTVDDKTALAVETPGRVAVNGPATIPGRIVSGCAALTGTVTVATEPR